MEGLTVKPPDGSTEVDSSDHSQAPAARGGERRPERVEAMLCVNCITPFVCDLSSDDEDYIICPACRAGEDGATA